MSDSLPPHGLQPTRLLCSWDLPGKNTGVGLPFPPPGDLPDPGIELESPVSLALAGEFFTIWVTREAQRQINKHAKVVTAKRKACVQSSRNRRAGRGPESRKEPDGIWQEVEAELRQAELRQERFSQLCQRNRWRVVSCPTPAILSC